MDTTLNRVVHGLGQIWFFIIVFIFYLEVIAFFFAISTRLRSSARMHSKMNSITEFQNVFIVVGILFQKAFWNALRSSTSHSFESIENYNLTVIYSDKKEKNASKITFEKDPMNSSR